MAILEANRNIKMVLSLVSVFSCIRQGEWLTALLHPKLLFQNSRGFHGIVIEMTRYQTNHPIWIMILIL